MSVFMTSGGGLEEERAGQKMFCAQSSSQAILGGIGGEGEYAQASEVGGCSYYCGSLILERFEQRKRHRRQGPKKGKLW